MRYTAIRSPEVNEGRRIKLIIKALIFASLFNIIFYFLFRKDTIGKYIPLQVPPSERGRNCCKTS